MHNPIIVQRLEAAAILAASVLAFHASGWSWWWFVALLFLVDYSLAGYLIGPKFGAALYNSMHSLIGPSALLGWWALDGPFASLAIGAVWLAHIGMDRAFGYGLKYEDGFHHTHLGTIGRGVRRAAS
jgi:hypothetical protein